MRIGIILVIVIVPLVLGALGKTTATDTHDFMMRAGKGVVLIGGIGAVFFGGCLIFSIIVGQTGVFVTGIFSIFLIVSLIFTLLAVPGFWQDEVKGDIIYSTRFWKKKKEINIKSIEKVASIRGELRCYVNGKSVLMIESIYQNIKLFIQRLAEESIVIVDANGKDITSDMLMMYEIDFEDNFMRCQTLAEELLGTTNLESKVLPEINGWYFYEKQRGGKSCIVDSEGHKLGATSSVSLERHLEEFRKRFK